VDTEQKLSQFADRVRQAASLAFPGASFTVVEKRKYLLKIRVGLSEKTFINIFYNPKNDRTDFALIRNEQRIFGYDNLGGWHRHPAEDPRSHIPCDKPSVEQVFQEMKSLVLPPTENPNDQS